MQNTQIELNYADADNYKGSETVVVSGVITTMLAKKIKSNLHDGEQIIAEQVGLPTPSAQLSHFPSYPCEDSDHVWTDFVLCDDLNDMLTTDAPNVDMSIADLAEKIATANWDITTEWDRLHTI